MSKDRCKRQERARAGFESLGESEEHGEKFGGRGGIGGGGGGCLNGKRNFRDVSSAARIVPALALSKGLDRI